MISIHAPARGATVAGDVTLEYETKFQSTLPQGERLVAFVAITANFKFQSTLPQGERRYYPLYKVIHIMYFNPRSRKGSDCQPPILGPPKQGFQSTLPQGERQKTAWKMPGNGIFQSTLPQGERRNCRRTLVHPRDFNPRSRKGSDS